MIVRAVLLIVVSLLPAITAEAGDRLSGREMIAAILADRSTVLVNGFVRSLRGETIDYHSAIATARLALLTRATDGSMAIEWQTAALPQTDQSSLTVFWLSAIAGSKGVHQFSMTVNGTSWCVFTSPRDTIESSWTIPVSSGGSYSFAAVEADRFGDFFGYSFLKIPVSVFRAGDSLTILITGEAAGSNCWYMTFKHRMEEAARAEALPCLVRDHGATRQVLQVFLEHYGPPNDAEISLEPAGSIRQTLEWGEETVRLSVDPVQQTERKVINVRTHGIPLRRVPVELNPVRRRELWLLPHSHNDIGYSDYQAEVENKQMRYLEDATAIARRSSDYPPGSQFRWNIEILWPLESYMRSASNEKRDMIVEAIKKGWIGVNALYANELTGLCRPEELYHLTDYARRFSSMYGVAVNSAMITDIPSYTSSIVTALAESGVRYFSSGPNYSPSVPDGGDRIGHALRVWGDHPFYWVSQSGDSKVLFWMAGTGYSFFHGWLMGHLSGSSDEPIYHYLNHLDSINYPYDMVQMRYTIDGDNGPPDPELADFVKQWNDRCISPTFHIATTAELFGEFERRYGKLLPEYRGDLTPIWEDGAASTARELAMNRRSAEQLVQDEILYSILDPAHYASSEFSAAWRNVVLFDEHTWGASNSITDPDSASVIAQWNYKLDMAVEASKLAVQLSRRILGPTDSLSHPATALTVINTNSWTRSGLVVIPSSTTLAGPRVTDEQGIGLPSQLLGNGDLAVYVNDVPPLGVKRLLFAKGSPYRPEHPVSVAGNLLAGDQIRARINSQDGSIEHLHDENDPGIDLVDQSRGNGIDEYLYVPGRDPAKTLRDSNVTITQGEKGPLMASIVVTSAPAGTKSLRREYSVIAGLDQLNIENALNKLKIRDKESIHFGFPFLIREGVMRVDEGLEVIRPELDQLQGANKDYFSVQRWVDVSNATRGLTWATVDAPLVEIGQITNEKPGPSGYRIWRETIEPAQNLYSYATNNYWHTNYRADQEGVATFRYALKRHRGFDRASATRFGIEASQPLILGHGSLARAHALPLFTVTPSSVIVTTVVPSSDGLGWCVHLLNAGDEPADARVRWSGPVKVYKSNLFQDRETEVKGSLRIPISGVRMLKVEQR